ncbi:MAG: magnesium-translocating P-type ATPase [Sebaldella sp.]|nr:magnesium-translocating P-type ATPase [Sebaldella sp.]
MRRDKKMNVFSVDDLFDYAKLDMEKVYEKLESSSKGLSEQESEERLEQYGLNEISYNKEDTWYVQLTKAFINPFILVLITLAVVSFVTDVAMQKQGSKDWTTVIIIVIMVSISGFLRFFQELRSNKEAEKLKALVHNTVDILRKDTGRQEIPMSELVPGDIIRLAAGDIIPGDLRIIHSKDLFISQSMLTGESESVEKYSVVKESDEKRSALELENICFMGTNVVSGTGIAIIVSTGNQTYFGSMAKTLAEKRPQTSFDKGVNSVSWLLIRFMFVMIPLVFFLNGFIKGDWVSAFLFALSIAVGLTPEMLPMIVTTNLAKGAVFMSKHKTVVKSLNSIQSFGAMDVLCTDKTGTLTQDKIVLEKHLNIHGNEDDRVLKHAYLNSYYQTGLKNLMDLAVIDYGREIGLETVEDKYTKVDEIPFDFARRRMSVVLKDKKGETQLVTKGAIEEMLSICSLTEYNGEVTELTDEIRNEVMGISKGLNEDGMRVIGVAYKTNPRSEGLFSVEDEKNMVLIGYIGFLDPPKDSAATAIKALHEYGVTVKVLTGDNEIVTKKICKEVGIKVDKILLGLQVEEMGEKELKDAVEEVTIFAKLSPLQKSRVVKALQSNGHTVGYMGDGINDAPALKFADVGISVDTAVEIAKESADIILLEKSLMVLEEGVIEGRRTFGNIIKYIKMTASSNFGNMFSVLVASIFLPFLPMLPIHILIQNLLYDISQVAIPWDTMDEDYLKQPRKWDASGISKFMIFIGPISSIFDIVTFLVMWYVFKASVGTEHAQALFHSGWFVEGLLSQTLIVHMIRTKKIPFIQDTASLPVVISTIVVMILGIIIPFTAFGRSVDLVALPFSYFIWLMGILFAYCFLTQIVKKWYIDKFKSWL